MKTEPSRARNPKRSLKENVSDNVLLCFFLLSSLISLDDGDFVLTRLYSGVNVLCMKQLQCT